MRFFLVDRVDEVQPGTSIRGVKNVTLSEDVLQDHFPEYPVFPGTLIVEALAQLGGFLAECSRPVDEVPVRRAVLGQIERARFYHPVRPGDQMELHGRLLSTLEGAAQVEGEARVGAQRVAVATLTFVLRSIASERVHEQRRALYTVWTQHLQLGFPLR